MDVGSWKSPFRKRDLIELLPVKRYFRHGKFSSGNIRRPSPKILIPILGRFRCIRVGRLQQHPVKRRHKLRRASVDPVRRQDRGCWGDLCELYRFIRTETFEQASWAGNSAFAQCTWRQTISAIRWNSVSLLESTQKIKHIFVEQTKQTLRRIDVVYSFGAQ
jgi:hypothetical protein